jgi:hypothetical protein
MERRIFHGKISAQQIARALVASFNRGNLRAQQVNGGNQTVVQIASTANASSGGHTALSIILQDVTDGVAVDVGEQAWLGVAASLGATALAAFYNPLNLLNRLDDIAQDIESLQLTEEVMKVIAATCASAGAGQQLSERLRRVACAYCHTANEVGASNCVACGAPLGDVQPDTCRDCGFVLAQGERNCPNCGKPV